MADGDKKTEQLYSITIEKLMTVPCKERGGCGLRHAITVSFSGILSHSEFESPDIHQRLLDVVNGFPPHSRQAETQPMTNEEANAYMMMQVARDYDPNSLQQNYMDDDVPEKGKLN